MIGRWRPWVRVSSARRQGVFTPSNVFPSNLATFDLDFANSQFSGGTQPATGNTDDGRFLRQQIVNTQPSFVENADGSLKTYTSTQLVRWSTRGMAIANDRTNRVLWNRDLTNAAWTKTNCTVLKNQTGRTNVANSASQVTVNATDATVSQAIVVTSLLQYGSVDVKRLSGSGTVSMSMDGGATYTVLNMTKPIWNGICRPSIPPQTLANPTMMLKFSTSGDVWLVDFVELSDPATANECEPIATTTASVKGWRDRAAAYTTDAGPLGLWFRNQATQAMYFEYAQRQSGALIASDGDLNISSTLTALSIGSNLTANAPAISADARLSSINKAMYWRSPAGSALCLNGGVVAKFSGFTPDLTGTHYDFGTNGAGNLSLQGMIKRAWFGSIIPSDAVMQAFTT